MFSRFLVFVLPLVGLCACAAPKVAQAPAPVQNRLVALMAERLEIAREVAWIKFQNGAPVKDPKRESELLTRLTEQGASLQLPPALTSAFFEAQIRASRTVQQELIAGWKRGAALPVTAPKDLVRDIRPRLDAISRQMLEELAQCSQRGRALPAPAPAMKTLRDRGFSWRVAWEASAPLR